MYKPKKTPNIPKGYYKPVGMLNYLKREEFKDRYRNKMVMASIPLIITFMGLLLNYTINNFHNNAHSKDDSPEKDRYIKKDYEMSIDEFYDKLYEDERRNNAGPIRILGLESKIFRRK